MPRAALLEETRKASVGLALMPTDSSNENFRNMVGASNKPFDYLACAVPLLISDLADWRATFVDAGFGLACDPNEAKSIARSLRWFLENKSAGRLMGELGRRRILSDWNYENCFGRAVGAQFFTEQDVEEP
jgi:glycosyltransferase involved in cell wall biosynthesis